MTPRVRARAAVLAGVSALLLAGCTTTVDGEASPAGAAVVAEPVDAGSSAPAGTEIAAAAADALEQAGSLRAEGTMQMLGEKYDVEMELHGGDLAGSFRLGELTMDMVASGDSLYMLASEAMWQAQGVPAAAAAGLAGTWVRVPAEGLGMEEATLAGIAAEVRAPSGGTVDDEVTAGELGGRPVWLVGASDGTVMYIAAEGTPYLLQTATAGMVTMTLSDFGRVDPIVPPEDFIDLE